MDMYWRLTQAYASSGGYVTECSGGYKTGQPYSEGRTTYLHVQKCVCVHVCVPKFL